MSGIDTPLLIFAMFFMAAMIIYIIGFICIYIRKCIGGTKLGDVTIGNQI